MRREQLNWRKKVRSASCEFSGFSFELYTEEIPSSYQIMAISHLGGERGSLSRILKENQIEYQSCEVDGTSRRLFLRISSLAAKQNSWEEEKKGPLKNFATMKQANPQNNSLGFCERLKTRVEGVKFKTYGEEEYASILSSCGGASSLDILGEEIPEMFLKIPFEKSMRTGEKGLYLMRDLF